MIVNHRRRWGIALVALSAVLWSLAGLFVRMADLDTWTIVAWRSIFSFLTLGSAVLIQNRASPARILGGLGRPAIAAVALSVVATISYVAALRLTIVANVMVIYAAAPVITTIIAFVWLRERATMRFLVAGAVAIVGIVVMARAAATGRDVLGIMAAVVMTIGFSVQLVHTKRHPSLNLISIGALTAASCAIITVPLMQPGLPAPMQLLACALFGILTTGVAFVTVLEGGRLIPSGEAGFISMIDVVLGPFWVWLAYDERPTAAVIAGGVIVLGSVIWYLSTNRVPEQASLAVADGG